MWTSIITALAAAIGSGWNRYQERKQAEHAVLIARDEARKELALATIKAESELGKAQLKATQPLFKYFTFFMWFGPFMATMLGTSYGPQVFENLKQLPEWYVQSCMAIMFGVWGIQVSREAIGNVVSGLSQYFGRRRAFKENRQLFYDVLRSTKGTISQHEVDLYEKALDKMKGDDK